MPVVTIQVTREGTSPGASSVTPEEKAALIKGASQLLLDILNKPLDATFVIIEEVDTSNWGWGRPARARVPTAPRGGNMIPKRQITKSRFHRAALRKGVFRSASIRGANRQ
jgi:4-oxalocrotonate tautomerase